MFRGITTQEVVKHRGRFGCVPAPKRKEKIMDIEKGFTEEKPFVRKDSAGLAQNSTPKTQSEGRNLLNMIEVRMKNLLQSLNAIESLTNNLNKNLLPLETQGESGKVEAKKPQGWLEEHLANLDNLLWQSAQIHDHVTRLKIMTR